MRESTEKALRWFLKQKLEEQRMIIHFRHMDSGIIQEPDSGSRLEIMELLREIAEEDMLDKR